MKRFFQIIGFVTLMTFSFFYTEKTARIVKNLDDLMIEIKEDAINHNVDSVDAIIKDDYIIPGLSGKKVDIEKSYEVIKKVGKYSPSLLVYKNIKPNISIKNNYNKYIISGNQNKKEVTFIFKIDKDDDIKDIKKILDENSTKATFFVDGNWFEDNSSIITSLIDEGYNIGNMGYNMEYADNKFSWMNTIITKIGNQKNNFCYVEKDREEVLSKCSLLKSYTIKPNLIIKDNPLITIKKNIKSGSIISFDINNNVISELPLIIKYINSKNYKIVNLETLISE